MKASELFDEYVDKIAVSSCTGFDSSEIDVLDKMTEKLRTAIAALEHENASLLTLQTEMQEYSNRHLRFSREQGEKILKLESDNAILERDHKEAAVIHKSDCAVYNMPYMPNGECDCGAKEAAK